MKERLKQLRKALDLTQTEFGERIGASRDAIAAYERGVSVKEPIIKLICNTYNVDYLWLTQGEGDMFDDIPESILDTICLTYNLNAHWKNILKNFLELSESERNQIELYIKKIFEIKDD